MDLGARQRTRQSWRRRAGSADVPPALAEVPVGDPARPAASFATPAVFRGLCSAWPACRWTEQSLARALPTVRVSRSRSGEYPRDSASGKPCPMETVPTARFLAALSTADDGVADSFLQLLATSKMHEHCPTNEAAMMARPTHFTWGHVRRG